MTKRIIKDGQKVKIGKTLYFIEGIDMLLPKDEFKSVGSDIHTYRRSVYLKKGTIMEAYGSGPFDEVEWNGGGHSCGLSYRWIDKKYGIKKAKIDRNGIAFCYKCNTWAIPNKYGKCGKCGRSHI